MRAVPLRSVSSIAVRRDVHQAVEAGVRRFAPAIRHALEAWAREHARGGKPEALRANATGLALSGVRAGIRLAADHAPSALASTADAVADVVQRADRPSARDRAERFAHERAAELVVQVDEGTRAAIKRVVADGMKRGLPPKTVGKLLRDVVPLDERRAGAVSRFRAALQDQGVRDSVADDRASRYAARLVAQRAEVIARTEMQTAVQQGRVELWTELQEQGAVPEGSVREKWITSRDERVDEDCDVLDNEVRELGGFEGPPLHVQCRCTTIISVEGF